MAGSGTAHLRPAQDRSLVVEDLVVEFGVRRGVVHAVSGLNLDLLPGETLGILGESGCGKSSAGKAIMQLPPPTSGSVRLADVDLTALRDAELRRARSRMQLVMQDPVSALNPRRKVEDLVVEGLDIWGWELAGDAGRDRRRFVDDLLTSVGLDPEVVRSRRPHELSGGQCQRVCIARALAVSPQVLLCDEPVSSLDVSVQAQILNLLEKARGRHGLSMVFIAHDVAVVKNISDRVLVMYLGKTCEVLPSDGLEQEARHPYTRLLLASVPSEADRDRPSEAGVAVDLPSPLDPPSGCRFRTRCPLATEVCRTQEPELREVATGHFVACHHVEVDR